MIEFINFYLIPGLVLGSIYALGAIGVTLTFGILRFANFAHGETMTLGAYFTLTLTALTGLHPLLFLPVRQWPSRRWPSSGWTGCSSGRFVTGRRSSWSSPRSG